MRGIAACILLLVASACSGPDRPDADTTVAEAVADDAAATVEPIAPMTTTAVAPTTTTAATTASAATTTTTTAAATTTTAAPGVTLKTCMEMLATLLPRGMDPGRYADANEERCVKAMAIPCAEAKENYRETIAEAEQMADDDQLSEELLPSVRRGASIALDVSCGLGTAATMDSP